MLRLPFWVIALAAFPLAYADLKSEIAADIRTCRLAAEGWKVQCQIDCMAKSYAGTYTVGFHGSTPYLIRNYTRRSSNGNLDQINDGYLQNDGIVYWFEYAKDYPQIAGVGTIKDNGYPFTSVLDAFEDQGITYDELIARADSVKRTGNKAEISGQTEGKSFKITVIKLETGWRVERSQMWFRKTTADLVSEVNLSEWTKKGSVELPRNGSGTFTGVEPAPVALRPSTFVTDFSTLERSEPLTLRDIYRPFTVVVAGPTKTLQMTAKGELVESSGILKAETNPWAWLYVSSVAGLVFFSALLLTQHRTRRSLSRKR